MTTLAIMKADIADDFSRTDLTSVIADAITKAITFYQPSNFWFNESRSETFSTVASQPRYTKTDDTSIGQIIGLDSLVITDGGQNRELKRIDPLEYELFVDNSASTGAPYSFTYYEQTIGLYPIPDIVYSIRMFGRIKKAAPATDAETDNVWMVEGYELIRSRAAADVAAVKVRDYEFAQFMTAKELREADRLRAETSKRIASGQIVATTF